MFTSPPPLDLRKLFGDDETARRVWYFLRTGGLTPEGTKAVSVQAGTYEELREAIPTLALFGGVYMAHHFEGDLLSGHLVVLTRETALLYGKSPEGLPTAEHQNKPPCGPGLRLSNRQKQRLRTTLGSTSGSVEAAWG